MGTNDTLIELRDIRKTYRSGAVEYEALRGVSLQVDRGEFVAIMGPSGSGKSTLMHIMGLLDQKDAGRYFFATRDIDELDGQELAYFRNQNIGFVFQAFNLLPRSTILDNVALPLIYAHVPRRERLERARACLEQVGLLEWQAHRPVEISGGQKQRVAIARALVTEAPVLLADEPTGNLDSKSSAEIMRLFESLNEQGMTIVVITHDQEVAAVASRRLYVRDGMISSVEPAEPAPAPASAPEPEIPAPASAPASEPAAEPAPEAPAVEENDNAIPGQESDRGGCANAR